MSKRRLVITAVLAGQSQAQVARRYGVSQGWISKVMARYRLEGEAAFEPRSRRPNTTPGATPPEVVGLVLALRTKLTAAGLDAGADTIGWHLQHTHRISVHRSTIHRILVRHDLVVPAPGKRPKNSYRHFQADQPNECWQSDFTHYRLTHPDGRPAGEVEIISWIDDHSRYALRVSAHRRITATIVADSFEQAAGKHQYPASTLTDNGMVYTVRLAGQGRRGGRTKLESELRRLGITQKNGKPNHPQTQGKVERFQQTLKKWLVAQPHQPATITALQQLLDDFVDESNHRRPHRALPHQATPATIYATGPRATPATDPPSQSHDRVRTDRIDKTGAVTLRVQGKLRHIGVGRTHARTPVKLLVHDLEVTIIHAATGEILRELTINPDKDYQPLTTPPQKKN
ncbi:IS481 family transposase [Tessaracoccus sp. SD287]|uniref:IS481 family transposase n=1 Tax=Tessaracoccus sp. SD287 TaxID=2782008 RepID=UPI001A964A5B|nr:IS481 family transposase [Tessaracoccus sp. SD287]MBO1032294.1 IS481 family transposase [Tessaracoccus sp. SD287]